ncbi:MAG: hypothetical protein GY725_08030 [bacterium]|nr:hypothetical protein [bacterium]
MIPQSREYLSLLMGAPSLSMTALREAGVEVLERYGENLLGLLVPSDSVSAYKELVRDCLQPGFWNDLVSPEEIIFIFKLRDGAVREYVLDDENRAEISALCSELNGDPLYKTSDLLNYFAANSFYRDVMVEHHGAEPR